MHRILAEVIRPIVEGQIKAWQDAHPEGERFPGHLISGIGKRITHDICSAETVERIKLALGRGSASVTRGQTEIVSGHVPSRSAAVSEGQTERPETASGTLPEQSRDAVVPLVASGSRRGDLSSPASIAESERE